MDQAILNAIGNVFVTLFGFVFWIAVIYFIVRAIRSPAQRAAAGKKQAAVLLAQANEAIANQEARLARAKAAGPVVEIAVGTGRLIAERNHISGIPKNRSVLIDTDLAARGTIVIGPMGSGKTRAVLQPFAGHWLTFNSAGMFAFADKPNWSNILVDIARFAGRTPDRIHVVGPGKQPWPLLRGLSPDSVANFVRTAMELGGNRSDKFFVSSAENLVRRVANVLYATSQEGPITIEHKTTTGEIIESFNLDYDLFSVSKLARMDAEALQRDIVPEIRARSMILDARGNHDAKRRIDVNLPELINAASIKAEKQREGIVGTIDAVLAPFFSEYAFEQAFSGSGTFDLGVLDRGDVVILDVDKDLYPNASVLAFLLGFEQMKMYMRQRIRRQDNGAHLNPVLFLADEYTNVADGKSHPEMWRISRESLVCPLIAYQIHTDLQGSIGREVADGMMQNFATRIVFGTTDPPTIALVQAGKSEVLRETVSENEGWQTGESSSSHPQGSTQGGSSGASGGTSRSIAHVERLVVDEQLMDSLQNHIKRSVPVDQQIAEVIVRTIQGSKRVLDVCCVQAWDPPRSRVVDDLLQV